MRRTIFLAGVLIATAMVAATAVHAAVRGDSPPAGSEARPTLKVTENADGSLAASWTKQSNQDSYQLIYDTNGALRPTASPSPCSFDPTEDCYAQTDNTKPSFWLYAANGTPLNCYDFGGGIQTSCLGDLDQADAATKATLSGLSVGKTYYFQVLVADHCFTTLACSKNMERAEYWSSVVAITVKKATPKPTPKPKPKPKKKP